MIIKKEHKDLLDDIFFNQNGGRGAFGTVRGLYLESHSKDKTISYRIVKEYLKSVEPYLLHKKALRKFKRRKMLNLYVGQTWAIDLVFYIYDKSVQTKQQGYCVNVLDCFAKYGFSRPIATKTSANCLNAFKSIIAEAGMQPHALFADRGTEFAGIFKAFCIEHNIKLYSTSSNQLHSFPIEIYNGILKTAVERRLSFQRNRKWTEVLQSAVKSINETQTPALDHLSPSEAILPQNQARIQLFNLKRKAQYANSFKDQKPAFTVGQFVKIVKLDPFRQRGFKARWSKEVYQITRILNDNYPIGYNVSSFGRTLFYKEQLSAAADPSELSKSTISKKILGIIGDKNFAIKWLRNGKPIDFELRYLVISNTEPESHYLNEKQVLAFDNGLSQLSAYKNRKK